MITIQTRLKYKHYLIANLCKLLEDIVEKLFFLFFLLMSILLVLLQSYVKAFIILTIPIILNTILPLIKYIYAKFYLHKNTIEYFFDDNSFGYKIGEFKINISKKTIKLIKIHRNCIVIKFDKQTMYIVNSTKQIQKAKDKLLQSNYNNLIT